jgi:energy-converting hydrogenase Eha subunit C
VIESASITILSTIMDVASVLTIKQSINTIIIDVHYFTKIKEKRRHPFCEREMKIPY